MLEAHGIQPVRIPLVGKKGGAVGATQTPGGQGFAAAVRACKDRAAEA